MLEEDSFLFFGPCDIISKSAHLNFLAIGNRREKVEKGSDY